MYQKALLTLLPVLALLSAFTSAAPLTAEPLHKLQVRKIPFVRDGEHPHMAFTRHQNAAVKRAHRLARSTPPDDSVFRERTLRCRRSLEKFGQLDKRPSLPLPANEKESDGATPTTPASANGYAAAPSPTVTIYESGNNADGYSLAEWEAFHNRNVTLSSSESTIGGLHLDITAGDEGYLAEISIGTPSQIFTVLIDSGSADTWVPSTACTQEKCGISKRLGGDVSSTFADLNTPWVLGYLDSNVSGTLCQDTMTIAGFTLVDQVFGVATQQSPVFTQNSIDGIMGLGFSSDSKQNTPTPIDSLANAHLVKQSIMGYALGRFADGNHNGEVTFGQADCSKLDPTTTQTLPVIGDMELWKVNMGVVTINGEEVVSSGQVYLDTGTSTIIGPTADVEAIHAQIEGSKPYLDGTGSYTIPCTTDAVVTMAFGNAAFQIDARDLIYYNATDSLTGDCFSSIVGEDLNGVDVGTWVLGDAFLKNVYMTTNIPERTVQLSGRTDLSLSSTFSPNRW